MFQSRYEMSPGVALSKNKTPRHIAIIMDGNGRWASLRGFSRTAGHRSGGEAVKRTIKACLDKNIAKLTLFAFGVENWKRPSREVRNLQRLFVISLRRNLEELHKNGVRLRFIGDMSAFIPVLQSTIQRAKDVTQENNKLDLNIALNYSGRWDILQAVNQAIAKGEPLDSDAEFESMLSLQGDEPDLFIRTGGVSRLSNFLLWDLAYTELYFTQCLWPDFDESHLQHAIEDFALRERRFGFTPEQIKASQYVDS